MGGERRRGLRRLPARRTYRQAAAFQAALGVALLLIAAFPPSPSTPAEVALVMGLSLLVLAVVTATAAPAWGPIGLELSLASLSLGVAVGTVSAATELGHVGPLVVLVTAVPFIAELLGRAGAWRQILLALAAWSVAILVSPIQHDADDYLLALGWVVVPLSTWVCVRMVDRLTALALTDPLTGVLNRHGLEMQATIGRSVAERSGLPSTVVAIDLDRFKAYNDRNGHPAGDRMLRDLTSAWQLQLRASDAVARTGGDEFVVVLPGTSVVEATALLERMSAASPSPWTAGAVEWRPEEDVFAAIARADAVLYERKAAAPEDRTNA